MRAQFGGTVDMQLVKQLGIVDNVLEQLIDRSLLNQETQRLGLDVPDEVIRNAIYENPAFRGPDGKFDRRLFAQVLMMNRLSEDQLVARMRQDIPRNDLLQAVTSGVAAAPPAGRGALSARNEKRVADIVSVPGVRDRRRRPAERGRADAVLRGNTRTCSAPPSIAASRWRACRRAI